MTGGERSLAVLGAITLIVAGLVVAMLAFGWYGWAFGTGLLIGWLIWGGEKK